MMVKVCRGQWAGARPSFRRSAAVCASSQPMEAAPVGGDSRPYDLHHGQVHPTAFAFPMMGVQMGSNPKPDAAAMRPCHGSPYRGSACSVILAL